MMSVPVIRIAMWSGPRNISTAMMRAFENRPDTAVSDEPFYAAYLAATGLDHPMREAILRSQPTDPSRVIAHVTGPSPGGTPIWYQKHMTHHMLAPFDRRWIDGMTNAFLLRAPEAVLASYVQRRSTVALDDIGIVQQAELFDRVADRLGRTPPVLDGDDVLTDPARALRLLCAACGIGFDPSMLQWPAGSRPSDGVWAPAWYDKVVASTGFGPLPASGQPRVLDDHLKRLADMARPFYERLSRHRIAGLGDPA